MAVGYIKNHVAALVDELVFHHRDAVVGEGTAPGAQAPNDDIAFHIHVAVLRVPLRGVLEIKTHHAIGYLDQIVVLLGFNDILKLIVDDGLVVHHSVTVVGKGGEALFLPRLKGDLPVLQVEVAGAQFGAVGLTYRPHGDAVGGEGQLVKKAHEDIVRDKVALPVNEAELVAVAAGADKGGAVDLEITGKGILRLDYPCPLGIFVAVFSCLAVLGGGHAVLEQGVGIVGVGVGGVAAGRLRSTGGAGGGLAGGLSAGGGQQKQAAQRCQCKNFSGCALHSVRSPFQIGWLIREIGAAFSGPAGPAF